MKQNSRGALIGGIILVVIGVIFLIGQILNIDIGSKLWPLFVIGFGLLFFIGMVSGGKAAGSLAIPGSIITMIGLILLYQNTFQHYESWAYVWSLIVVSVGIGLFINGRWVGNEAVIRSGRFLIGLGLILFLIFGSFFELIIGISGRQGTGSIIWPLFLIGIGLYFLFGRKIRTQTTTIPTPPVPPAPPVIESQSKPNDAGVTPPPDKPSL